MSTHNAVNYTILWPYCSWKLSLYLETLPLKSFLANITTTSLSRQKKGFATPDHFIWEQIISGEQKRSYVENYESSDR